MTADTKADVLIIGAGISGVIAANVLQSQGVRVIVLDKGRGVGGRIATRRTAQGVFDHGAQFFTARHPEFRIWVERWQAAAIVRPWAQGFALSDGTVKQDGETRFCGVGGMTAIPKQLAQGCDVRLTAKVVRVHADGRNWLVTTEAKEQFSAAALLLTPPVPQTLELLRASDVTLPAPIQSELEQLTYAPCLALLAQLAGASAIPEPGGLWCSGEPIAWMADNQRKRVSGAPGSAVTIHAGPQFSQTHWNTPDDRVTDTLLEAAAPWLGSRPVETQLHRWRYSVPLRVHPDRCVIVREPAPLVLAGDAFGGPRVEGAALAGLAASEALREILASGHSVSPN